MFLISEFCNIYGYGRKMSDIRSVPFLSCPVWLLYSYTVFGQVIEHICDWQSQEGVIDQLYELLLEYFHANAHTIGFPELALPALLELKGFLKACKVSNFTKQIKQIVDKVRENSEFVTARRRSSTISLAARPEITRWERECEEAGTPLGKFYKTWRKMRDRELMHLIASRDQFVGKDKGLPEIERPAKGALLKASDDDNEEFSALFEGDSDDEEEMAARFLTPGEKKKKKKDEEAEMKKKGQDSEDDYSDLDSDDLAQLAGSGSDGSDAEMDDGKAGDDDDDDDDEEASDDDDDDGDDAEDIVQEFTMSSDED